MSNRHEGDEWAAVAAPMARLAQAIADPSQDQEAVCTAGLSVLLQLVPEADAGSVSVATPHAPAKVVAATSKIAALADQLQHKLSCGPAVEALSGDALVVTDDVGTDARWPELAGPLVEAGIHAALSCCLPCGDDRHAALSLFAIAPGAFDEAARSRVAALASYLATALLALTYRDRVTQLEHAVQSNREIGIATGIVMTRRLCTADQAFAELRRASEHQHRKLREVAERVITTGEWGDATVEQGDERG